MNSLYPDMGTTVRKICGKNDSISINTFGVREYVDKEEFTKSRGYKWTDYKTI